MIAAAIIRSPAEYEFSQMVTSARAWLKYYNVGQYLSAVAMGWDTAFAHAAMLDGIPVLCAIVPGADPVSRWDSLSRDRHNHVVARASQAFILGYAAGDQAAPFIKAGDDWRATNAGVIFYDSAEPMAQPLDGKTYVNLGGQ